MIAMTTALPASLADIKVWGTGTRVLMRLAYAQATDLPTGVCVCV